MNNVLALQRLSAETGGGAVEDDSGEAGQEVAASNLSALTCDEGGGFSGLSLLVC